MTTLSVNGVSRLSTIPGGVNRIWKRGHQSEGVRIEVIGDVVNVDLYLIFKPEVNLRQVSRKVQEEVARAISEMVGMKPGKINVHVEDIDYESPVVALEGLLQAPGGVRRVFLPAMDSAAKRPSPDEEPC